MALATVGARRPALLIRVFACTISSPTESTKPSPTSFAFSNGLFSASIAPFASASPRYASISEWLSMMPVEGE